MTRSKTRAAAIAAVLLVAGAIAAWAWSREPAAKPPLGLYTSLPIYWAEAGSVSEALDGGGEPHWVRGTLEADYRLIPLDTLDPADLAPLTRLVMAQPRPLAPGENVALDDWVRRGGRLLMFADPFLTEHSRFPLGDKRRPQDVALLSPILARWGLELTFDEDQGDGERAARLGSVALPHRLSGRFRVVTPGAPATCELTAGGLVATCRIGAGRALVVADAAVLEHERGPSPALPALMERALAD